MRKPMARSSRLSVCLEMEMRNSPPEPLRQVDQPPAHNAMDGRDGSLLDHLHKVLALGSRELGSRAGRLAGDETGRTFGIEPQHPVAEGLETDVADPGCIATATAIVDLRQREKPPDLVGMA